MQKTPTVKTRVFLEHNCIVTLYFLAGPHVWQKYAPIANGQRQSPINIEPAKCVFDSNLRANPLTYKYDPNKATSLVNTGMSAQIKYDSEGSSK